MPAGTRGPLRESVAQETAQQHTGDAEHSAFPARWVDGLCRALPGAEFLLASVASRIDDAVDPVGRDHLRKSLTVATTARTTRFSRTQRSGSAQGLRRTRLVAVRSARTRFRAHEVLILALLPHPRRRCRVHRTPTHVRDDVRSPLSSGRDGGEYAVNPNFGKVEYFCEGGLTGFWREVGVLPDGLDRRAYGTQDAEAPTCRAAQVRLILPFDCR